MDEGGRGGGGEAMVAGVQKYGENLFEKSTDRESQRDTERFTFPFHEKRRVCRIRDFGNARNAFHINCWVKHCTRIGQATDRSTKVGKVPAHFTKWAISRHTYNNE